MVVVERLNKTVWKIDLRKNEELENINSEFFQVIAEDQTLKLMKLEQLTENHWWATVK